MRELVGELYGDAAGARTFHIGAFAEPRIHGHPVTWIAQQELGPFRLAVPPGSWYIHAVGVPTSEGNWPSSTTAGSYGGIYGFGRPVTVPGDSGQPLRIHVSPLWRDLTHAPNQRHPGISDEHWRLIHHTMEHMAANLSASVESDLGPTLGLTRTRLSAVFKRGAGLTLEEYRIRLRLEAAKALLVRTDLEVLQVALEVGYSTAAQLGRSFQKFLGVSPAEFRRLARALQVEQHPLGTPVHLLKHLLMRLTNRGASIHGEVTYQGKQRGSVIYIGAFPGPFPTAYPSAWTALAAPGPFTLRGVPAGTHYILACYCSRRMFYPGDFGTAFAYGGHGYTDLTGRTPYASLPLTVTGSETVRGLWVPLVDGDYAASFAGRWGNTFLPDGR